MSAVTRTLSLATALFVPLVSAHAAAPADATGHWEGAVHTNSEDVQIAVDIASDEDGNLIGTFSNPSQYLKGFPFRLVAVDGTSVTFELKTADPGVQTFLGELSPDGQSVAGDFHVGIYSIPFSLERTGEAHLAPVPRGPALDASLVGEWGGTLDLGGRKLPLALTLTNHANGTSTGEWTAGEGTPTPIAITIDGGNLTLTSTVTPFVFAGAVNADGTEIAGTITQGSLAQPFTFARVASEDPVDRWANAVGGRDRVAQVQAIYREAVILVNGFEGTINVWHTADGRYRKEERGPNFARIEIYDGTHARVQTGAAPVQTLAGAHLERAISQAFANTNAMFFAFFPERRQGELLVEDDGTIVMKPRGGIDWRVVLDPATSLPKTMTHEEGDRTVTVDFVAYETVEGLRVESEIHRSLGAGPGAVIRYTKTIIDPALDASLFTLDSAPTE